MVRPEMLSDSPVKYSVFVGGVLIEMPVMTTSKTVTSKLSKKPPYDISTVFVPL